MSGEYSGGFPVSEPVWGSLVTPRSQWVLRIRGATFAGTSTIPSNPLCFSDRLDGSGVSEHHATQYGSVIRTRSMNKAKPRCKQMTLKGGF